MITPIRGRKQAIRMLHYTHTFPRLEMITPIRGRKHFKGETEACGGNMIRNDNPDKGTETRARF